MKYFRHFGTLLLILTLAGAVSARQPIDIETAWQFQRIGDPTVSPDGKFTVAPITRVDMDKDKMTADLWLFATDGSSSRLFSSQASSASSPVFSPDGRWLAFLSRRGDDEGNQLYALPMAGGEAVRLTEVPTGVNAFRWMPDSKQLLFATRTWGDLEGWEAQQARIKERKEGKMTAKVWDNEVPVTSWDHFVDERQTHLYRVTLAGGDPVLVTGSLDRQLPRSGVSSSSFDISPDGKRLAFVSDTATEPGQMNYDILLVDLGAGQTENLTAENAGPDLSPLFSPDGRYLAYAQQTIPGFYADTARLVLLDLKTKERKILTSDWDRSVSGLAWAGDSRSLYGSIDDAGTLRLYQFPVNGAPRRITTEPSFSSLDISRTTPPVGVAVRQSFVEAPELVKVDLRSGDHRVLSSAINRELNAKVEWGTKESVTYTGADGKPIQMWINYPPNFDPSKEYPLFLLIHGGPHNAIPDGMHWRWNAQVFSAMGYVTAWPNFHGSSGFGQEFADSITADWVSKPYEDVIKATEWLQEQPWIDSERMVAGGGSYGGYLTTILLGREHPFKALIAHAAVYNLYTQYGADFHYRASRHGDFWEDPERFQKTSPHYQAGNFKTPTLVIHGMLDYRVPVNHGVELYQTLKRQGVPSKLIVYPNENHWILNPQNSVFWYEEVEKWINEYAPPGPR